MLKPITIKILNRLFSIQLFIILCLGSYGSWCLAASDMLIPIILGSIFWLLLVVSEYRYSKKSISQRFYWVGLLQLITCWTIFPLFKSIRYWIYHWNFDNTLYQLDKFLWFGKSLPEWVVALQSGWISETLSLCYFSFYFLIIFSALFFFFLRNKTLSQRFFSGLMLMYLFGFLGYFFVPASGPYYAFPSDFNYPVHSGVITLFVADMVDQGITGMDVFPSLHTGITLYIVGILYLSGYKKVAFCLLPLLVGLVLATVYLHYHYGIDIILGALLAFLVLFFLCKNNKVKYENHL